MTETKPEATVVATDAPAPGLDAQLCFDLYSASRAITNAYRPVLSELGITYPQYLVLLVLWEEGPITMRRLSDALALDHGTLTPLLRRMENAGLVSRRRSPDDERYVEVSLTEEGDRLRAHAHGIHCDMVERLGLTPEEFRALQTTLRTLTRRVS